MRWIRNKLPWILGLLILTGSLLGANSIMHAPRNGDATGRKDAAAMAERNHARSGAGVVCQGMFVPENDLISLVPTMFQMGSAEVVEVFVKNEQAVKKGDPLLRLDDRMAKIKLNQAEAGVLMAEALLKEAKQGLKQFEMQRLSYQQEINAKRLEYQGQKKKLAKAQHLKDNELLPPTEDIDSAKLLVDALDIGIKAKEIALQGFELSKPDIKIEQAEAKLKEVKALHEQAQVAVDACLMVAPADGTIVKVNVGVGSKFGPQIQQPAFFFYSGGLTVRAEVDQEFVNRLQVGQKALVEDYSNSGETWKGQVTFVANSFLPRRDGSMLPEMLQQSQDRVLECRITLDPNQAPPRLNQRVRIRIGMN